VIEKFEDTIRKEAVSPRKTDNTMTKRNKPMERQTIDL
jgi:hypothetical protein